MSYLRLWRHASIACTVAFAASSWAAPVVFQGTDLSPNGQVPGNGKAASARGQLTAQLAKAKKVNENFDGFAVGPSRTLTVGGGLATLTPLGTDPGWIENQNTNGRFDTSNGNGKWWETSTSFVVDFAQNISAFGFYGTDFADFGGTLTLELLVDGVVSNSIEIATKPDDESPGNGNGKGKGNGKGQGNGRGQAGIAATPGAGNGSLLFFGFNDTDRSYDAVRFVIGQGLGQEDYLGFDDFVFALAEPGDPGDPGEVPEPATLALTAVALAGVAAGRRRRPR